MKYYNSYMDRQEISRETHEKLLNLTAQRRPARTGRQWMRYGALAACAALIVGVGAWKLAPGPAPTPDSAGQFAAGYAPLPGERDTVYPENHPLMADGSQTDGSGISFVVSSPGSGGKLMFPMIPFIHYPEVDRAVAYADRTYAPGSFMVDLTKEDIQAVFWGPEGKPESSHPKTEQGDLPWMLFWDGYTVHGYAWYDDRGQLIELTISGGQGQAEFELALCPDSLPFTDVIYTDPRNEPSDVLGVSVAGWSRVCDRFGGGEVDYTCGSEFMTEGGVGVRFVNRNSLTQAEYGGDGDMELGGAKAFNALFVRQALTGGLYLDHLMAAEPDGTNR